MTYDEKIFNAVLEHCEFIEVKGKTYVYPDNLEDLFIIENHGAEIYIDGPYSWAYWNRKGTYESLKKIIKECLTSPKEMAKFVYQEEDAESFSNKLFNKFANTKDIIN